MVGFRGAPTRLAIKLENPLFFFSTLFSLASSLYLWRGLRMPDGMRSSMAGGRDVDSPCAASICESRTEGLAVAEPFAVVVYCDGAAEVEVELGPAFARCDGGADAVPSGAGWW